MGQFPSKAEQRDGERESSRTAAAGRGLPLQPSVADSKRRASGLRSTNRAILENDNDAFVLDESQSRSTESTQGSPEIGMYPSKSPKGRKGSSCSAGARWFRRPSLSGGTHNKETLKNEPLPPSYLVFKQQPEPPRHKSLKSLPAIPSEKTAPVPVTRKSQSLMHIMGSHSDGGVGDPEARADELQRMYDLRTWDMYLRITEARKSRPVVATAATTMIPHHQQQQQPQRIHMPIRAHEDYDYFTPGDDSFVESYPMDVSQSEELIFGDLE